MAAWNQARVIEWFNQTTGKEVRITCQSEHMFVEGVCHGVLELDACSTQFHEVEVSSGLKTLQMTLTIHRTALTFTMVKDADGIGTAKFCIPYRIPFSKLALSLPDSGASTARAEEKTEPEFSPYELL